MAADNRVFAKELVDEIVARLNIADLENATIGEVLLVASALEEKTGINTMVAEDAMTVVATGTGKFIEFIHDKKKDEYK